MQENIKTRIEQVINNVSHLPSLPDVVSKIINMVNDPNVDFKLVGDEIAKDQAITTNILKLCNSAYFSKGKEITSIDKAIVTLGIKEVKDIVIVATTKQVLNKTIAGYDLAEGELWKHNLAVAMLSKKIALDLKKRNLADVVFTGGIIHDVGKTIIALYVANTFKDILELSTKDNISFVDAEKLTMGYNHQEIGQIILNNWKFPEVLQAIVRYHHEPENAPKEFKEAVSVVHIANVICQMAGIGIGSDGLYQQFNTDSMKLLGLTDKDVQAYYSKTPELLKQVQQIM